MSIRIASFSQIGDSLSIQRYHICFNLALSIILSDDLSLFLRLLGMKQQALAEDWRLVREMERAANKSVCLQHLSVFQQTLTDVPLHWTQTHPRLKRCSLKGLFIYIDCWTQNVRINVRVGAQKLLHRHQMGKLTWDFFVTITIIQLLFAVLFIQCV